MLPNNNIKLKISSHPNNYPISIRQLTDSHPITILKINNSCPIIFRIRGRNNRSHPSLNSSQIRDRFRGDLCWRRLPATSRLEKYRRGGILQRRLLRRRLWLSDDERQERFSARGALSRHFMQSLYLVYQRRHFAWKGFMFQTEQTWILRVMQR